MHGRTTVMRQDIHARISDSASAGGDFSCNLLLGFCSAVSIVVSYYSSFVHPDLVPSPAYESPRPREGVDGNDEGIQTIKRCLVCGKWAKISLCQLNGTVDLLY